MRNRYRCRTQSPLPESYILGICQTEAYRRFAVMIIPYIDHQCRSPRLDKSYIRLGDHEIVVVESLCRYHYPVRRCDDELHIRFFRYRDFRRTKTTLT